MIVEDAPAKVNLALHVVGQRPDGYHLLQSLVTFAGPGDRLEFRPADRDGLTISGRFASGLTANPDLSGNLVAVARERLRAELAHSGRPHLAPVHIHLEKNLPLASGIGGGSADAAATLRGLNRFWAAGLTRTLLGGIGLDIGADVPMCVECQPLLAEGIGEIITPRPDLPSFPMLLVNPLVEVSTPMIFRHLSCKTNPRLTLPPAPSTVTIWLPLLASWRNDLEGPAEALEPVIGEVIHLLAANGARLARMSGSGATCYGLFETLEEAENCQRRIAAIRPDWYVHASMTIGAH